MDSRKETVTLDKVPVDRKLIEELYSHGMLTPEARETALGIIYPRDKWGLWIARLLLIIGSALILSGIIYFFAFNWDKITKAQKLTAVELGMVICVIFAFIKSLEKLSGRVFILSACVLTGVFCAVYGQVYQTGADAYELFMYWSILTIGWVAISKFAPLWFVWLIVTNAFAILYYEQVVRTSWQMEYTLFSILTILNGAFLILKEIFVARGHGWLKERWLRAAISIVILITSTIPILAIIIKQDHGGGSLIIASSIGVAGLILMYGTYRFKIPDMLPLSATVLSLCIIAETAAIKMLTKNMRDLEEGLFLLLGIITIGIFTFAVMHLRAVSRVMEEVKGV